MTLPWVTAPPCTRPSKPRGLPSPPLSEAESDRTPGTNATLPTVGTARWGNENAGHLLQSNAITKLGRNAALRAGRFVVSSGRLSHYLALGILTILVSPPPPILSEELLTVSIDRFTLQDLSGFTVTDFHVETKSKYVIRT